MGKNTMIAVAGGVAVMASGMILDFVLPKLPIDPLGTGAKVAKYAVAFGVGFGAIWLAQRYIAK